MTLGLEQVDCKPSQPPCFLRTSSFPYGSLVGLFTVMHSDCTVSFAIIRTLKVLLESSEDNFLNAIALYQLAEFHLVALSDIVQKISIIHHPLDNSVFS